MAFHIVRNGRASDLPRAEPFRSHALQLSLPKFAGGAAIQLRVQ